MGEEEKIRINKYLASIGVGARRKIDQLILQGKIKLNGQILTTPGIKINPHKDIILVNDKLIGKDLKAHVYIILNKPKGLISSAADEHGRETVVSWVDHKERIFPVGRLDRFSSGLIILTNDGDLALRLTHPRFLVKKTYHVRIFGRVTDEQIKQMQLGVKLRHFSTAPADVKILESDAKTTLLEIILKEGKNREIRRMCGKLGLEVLNLDRVAFGPLKLGNLKIGEYRELTEGEIKQLKS